MEILGKLLKLEKVDAQRKFSVERKSFIFTNEKLVLELFDILEKTERM